MFMIHIHRTTGNSFRLLRSVVRLTDRIRFHILRRHGGVYIDSDVLLLRDLTPLCNGTFAYQWSDTPEYNSAVFGCPRRCAFISDFIAKAGGASLAYHPLKWRSLRAIETWPTRLPVMVFDPVWLKEIGADAIDPATYVFTSHKGALAR